MSKGCQKYHPMLLAAVGFGLIGLTSARQSGAPMIMKQFDGSGSFLSVNGDEQRGLRPASAGVSGPASGKTDPSGSLG